MRRSLILTLLLASPALLAQAPAPLSLTLEEGTKRALAKNQDIAIEREFVFQADQAVVGTKGAYDPGLAVDGSWRKHTDPVNSLFAGAPDDELAPHMEGYSLGASLAQYLPTGGTVSLFTTLHHDTTNNIFIPLSPAWGTSIGLSLRQPLLQNFSIDPQRQAIRIAAINRDGETAHLRRTVTDTVAAVEIAYWSLVAARRGVEVLESSVALAKQQLNETQIRVDAGVLAKTDLAQPTAELERRRGLLAETRDLVNTRATALKLLILWDHGDPDWEREILPTDDPAMAEIQADVPTSIDTALRNRPEVLEAGAVVSRAGINVEAGQSAVKPRLDLIAQYSRQGLSGALNPYAEPFQPGQPVVIPEPLDGGLGRSYGTIGENRFPDVSVGLQFSFPIMNRAAKANLAAAKSVEEQAKIAASQTNQRIVADVRDAVFGLTTQKQRLEAARAGRAAAETQLFAEQERFAVGLSTNFFVLTRQNDLTSARVTEISALTDYRRAAIEFARAQGTLLSDRRITIEPPAAAGGGGK
jgi:outer membrane protein TolC